MQVEKPSQVAIARKYPEQIVVAVCLDAQGKYNPITLGWTMITSSHPLMMAISVGLTRHTVGAIRHGKEFVIAFPSSMMASDVRFFGTRSGRDVDKLAACGTETEPAREIDGRLLSDAVANFECVLESQLRTGDHVIFVGQVVCAHVNTDPTRKRLFNLGEGQFDTVASSS